MFFPFFLITVFFTVSPYQRKTCRLLKIVKATYSDVYYIYFFAGKYAYAGGKTLKRLKCYTLIGIIFVIITGSLAHFVYEWTGNHLIIGLFTPINESVREHMKLIFFPMLLYGLVMNRNLKKEFPCITSSLSFGILLGTFLVPVFFYAYTFLTGRDVFALDLADFVLSIVIAFAAVYKLTLSCRLQPFRYILYGLVCLTGAVFIWLSYFLISKDFPVISFGCSFPII